MPFLLDHYIQDCKDALNESESQAAIRELTREAISDPGQVIKELGEPRLSGLETLYHSEDLTILNIIWAPGMTLHPHNHCMWANIGIYGGEEENNYFQNTPDGLVQRGQNVLVQGEVSPLHHDVIHSVHNPLSTFTAAIHVYGGDFFNAPRSEWMPDDYLEQPYDVENTRALFRAANENLNLL